MKNRLLRTGRAARQVPGVPRALLLTLVFSALALGASAQSQEPTPAAQSLPDAARVAR